MKMTLATKGALALLVTAVIYILASHYNVLPGARVQEAAVPRSFSLPTADAPAAQATAGPLALPSATPAQPRGPQVRANIWAWNAQMALIYANGGPVTTSGSLMDKHGVRLVLDRVDDTEKSKAEQVKFAAALATGADNPSDGIHFVVIMGDGAAQYLAATNKLLDKLGANYHAEVVGAVGYSRGEDAFMGPQAWKDSPAESRGGVVAGVLRDGDWNIAQYWLAQNGIKNNPDERTWDPEALNWASADDYVKAAEMYVGGYCDDRDVVRHGKRTGEKHHACVDGVVTWTPGDVTVAKKKGGLVKVLSTKENAYQMPAVVIGIHKWDAAHAKTVEDFLAASFEAADQVRAYPEALQRAAKASYAVYKEESPAYWLKYYRGVVESDKQSLPVPLGGSSVMNLGDNLLLFGLSEGSGGGDSLFKQTYEGFGTVAQQQYPQLVPDFPKAQAAANLTFLSALKQRAGTVENKPEPVAYEAGLIEKDNVVARRDWTVQFETGKATFTPEAEAMLNELYAALAVNTLQVEVDGHTDSTGGASANVLLSGARAGAVKDWLRAKSPALFPASRVTTQAFGDQKPVADNDTAAGRAKNRRVTVIIGNR